ncbi:MAG: xanthine dehydrogenase family protein subunit M [Alphaproteobacteria bacterium]|nr:xanthine dehydrogenase family protein subunit M [Alphaproteobacteria bacterium]
MYAFDYIRPATIAEARRALSENAEAQLLAGGQTLLPVMKMRLASPAAVVDLGGVGELRGVTREGDKLVIGAMTTHAEVAEAGVVRSAIPALAALAESIGDPQVRNRGTIGGSIANDDPAADYPAGLLALGATIVTTNRSIPVDDFFQGMFTTALEPGEIITAVECPVPDNFAYEKFAHPASRYALVGVAVARQSGVVRVAVTGAGESGVYRWTEAETALAANFDAGALDGLAVDEGSLLSDMHADATYRANLVKVMAKRAAAMVQ